MITDPDRPSFEAPAACGNIYQFEDGVERSISEVMFQVSAPIDNGEPIDMRQGRVYDVGPSSQWCVGPDGTVRKGGHCTLLHEADGIHTLLNSSGLPVQWLKPVDDYAQNFTVEERVGASPAANAQAMTQLSGNFDRVVANLEQGQCYQLSVRSRNTLGWSDWAPPGQVCCVYFYEPPPHQVPVAMYAVSGTGLLLICILVCLIYKIYSWYSQFNATTDGGGKKKKKNLAMMDGSKKVERFMDNEYTPGVDDAEDITVNPVFLHKIDEEKRKKREAKLKKTGSASGTKSGGLARLNLQIDAPKEKAGGKMKGLLDVEKYLAGQKGIDVSESRHVKNTQAGKKSQTVLAASAAAGGGSSTGLFTDARAKARARRPRRAPRRTTTTQGRRASSTRLRCDKHGGGGEGLGVRALATDSLSETCERDHGRPPAEGERAGGSRAAPPRVMSALCIGEGGCVCKTRHVGLGAASSERPYAALI